MLIFVIVEECSCAHYGFGKCMFNNVDLAIPVRPSEQ